MGAFLPAFWNLIAVCLLLLLPLHVKAQEPIKSCAKVDVRSVTVSLETGVDWPLNSKAEIALVPEDHPMHKDGQNLLSVIAYGPILNTAMNSPTVKTQLACTLRGVALNVTITHFSDDIDVAKNAIWRSKIKLSLALRGETVLEAKWVMRWPDGTEVNHSEAPPYPAQQFPISLDRILRKRDR